MGWFADLFNKPIASQMHERMVVSDLKAIEQVPPAVQRAIADDVSRFIDMARVNSPLLDQFLAAEAQDQHHGGSSKKIHDGLQPHSKKHGAEPSWEKHVAC